MLTRRELLTLCAAAPAWAWQDVRFTTGVRVVNILASVRDQAGKIVSGLTQDDFTLEEEGAAQEIRYFTQEVDLPLVLGLIVDVSGSMTEELGNVRRASRQFLRKVLHEGRDRAFLIQFAREVELQQDLTSSRRSLDKAADEIGDRGRVGLRMRLGTGSAIQDAIFLGADEVLRLEQGRKAIVLLSDGGENGSRTSLSTAIETAQRADTLIYTIRFYERPGGFFVRLSRPAREGISRMEASQLNLMRRLARETGGDYFDRNEQSLDDIYKSIEEDLRHQYSLGYTPKDPQPGYRRIRLTVKRPGLFVRTREGYYGA